MRTKYSFKMQSPEFLDWINYSTLFLVFRRQDEVCLQIDIKNKIVDFSDGSDPNYNNFLKI